VELDTLCADSDAVMATVDSDFIDDVTSELRPGTTAIIVEANERAVDDIVALGGGHVYRQDPARSSSSRIAR
jgi:hypothetical protein